MTALVQVTPPAVSLLTVPELKAHARIDLDEEDVLIADYIAAGYDWLEEVSGRTFVTQTWDWMLDQFPSHRCALTVPRPPLQQVVSVTYLDEAGDLQTWDTANYVVDTASTPGRLTPAYGVDWPHTYPQINAVTLQFVAGIVTPITVDPDTDIVTASGGRSFAEDEQVRLSGTRLGTLPGGLTPATRYFVINTTGSTFQLSLTQGGAAIDITDVGSGLHFIGQVPTWVRQAVRLLAADFYTHREDTTPREMRALPRGVSSLLWANREW